MSTRYADVSPGKRDVAKPVVPTLAGRMPATKQSIPVFAPDGDNERISIGRGIVLAVLIIMPLWGLFAVFGVILF